MALPSSHKENKMTEETQDENVTPLYGKKLKAQQAQDEKGQLILGHMVEGIINTIKIVEICEGRNMFFAFDVPLRDGRKLSITLKES